MELIGKFLFVILLSVSIGAGAVYIAGPDFFTSNLDNNIFESDRAETSKVDIKEYRKKLDAEYNIYNDSKETTNKNNNSDKDPIWQDTVDYKR